MLELSIDLKRNIRIITNGIIRQLSDTENILFRHEKITIFSYYLFYLIAHVADRMIRHYFDVIDSFQEYLCIINSFLQVDFE